jgi:hypothetical protein
MNEHAEARAALEIAAVEPGGLDRLEAGDTAEAVAVAGHLAGCPSCLEELARLRRAETLLRPIVAAAPDPALRERTLAFVRAVGVQHGAAADAPAPLAEAPSAAGPAADAPVDVATPGRGFRRGGGRRLAWPGAIAAALVIGLAGGALVTGRGAPAGNADPAVALATVSRETAALLATGDAREVALRDAAGTPAGTLVLSPSAGRMTVTATGLAAPAPGTEYRCWVEAGGSRTALGTMWWAGGVAWWGGEVALPADLPPGVLYGVSLVTTGSAGPGTVELTGAL